jgi:hypothetical protein
VTFGVNLDFRYDAGYPPLLTARRLGLTWVRVISLPVMEYWAEQLLLHGCQVIAVYTGESEAAGRYVMNSASVLQVGNEPFMGGAATWPAGNANAFVKKWLEVRDLVWDKHGQWFPLMGPGMWVQDYSKWASIADRIEGVTTAAVHVYGHSPEQARPLLERYRAVRPDIPLFCSEWMARWPDTLALARTIDTFCTGRCWYTWDNPGEPHHTLAATPEMGILLTA